MKRVYAMELEGVGVKIGVSKNVRQRAKDVEREIKAKVVEVYYTELVHNLVAFRVESACHHAFADRLVAREYFGITLAEARAEIECYSDELWLAKTSPYIARRFVNIKDWERNPSAFDLFGALPELGAFGLKYERKWLKDYLRDLDRELRTGRYGYAVANAVYLSGLSQY